MLKGWVGRNAVGRGTKPKSFEIKIRKWNYSPNSSAAPSFSDSSPNTVNSNLPEFGTTAG